MKTVIVCIVLVIVLGLAVRHIYKSLKKRNSCVGCPCAGTCGSKRGCKGNPYS